MILPGGLAPMEMPPLPEGMFWNVEYSRTHKWYWVQLRRKKFIGSEVVAWRAIEPYSHSQLKRVVMDSFIENRKVHRACQEAEERAQRKGGNSDH